MSRDGDVRRRWASLVLMMASGFAGLGYEIVWTQQCALWLGHESAAVLAVVAAFFGGLAVGGLALGSRIERSTRPVRWYAGCELIVALWSLLLLVVAAPFSGWVLGAVGTEPSAAWQWSIAFCATFFLFLPATGAMGATLPAMERLTAQMDGESRTIAALYASNTFGSVVGVLAAAFWLIPAVGLAKSAAVSIALNLLCGAVAVAIFPTTTELAEPDVVTDAGSGSRAESATAGSARGAVWRLAFTGFLGIGYEVLVVRVLSQVTEDTVYTFAMLLAVYLVGGAAGAAAYRRWLEGRAQQDGDGQGARSDHRSAVADRLLAALAAACLTGMASLWAAESVKAAALQTFGTGVTAALGAEAVLAVLAFGPPTMVMGALFSHLSGCANAHGVSFGRALGVNMLAAAAAPALAGVLAVPALGAKVTLVLIVLGYLASTTRRAWSTPIVWVPAAAALSVALLAPPLAFVEVPEGGHVVRYQEGVMLP